jgi:Flp pilus assembly protein TadD
MGKPPRGTNRLDLKRAWQDAAILQAFTIWAAEHVHDSRVDDSNSQQNASETFSGRSPKSLSIQKFLDDVIVYRPELVYYIRRPIVKRFFRGLSLESSDVYCARHDQLQASASVLIRCIGENVPRIRPSGGSIGVTSLPQSKLLGRRAAMRTVLMLAAALCLLSVQRCLGASCHGPSVLEANVRVHPSVQAYADLGSWFRDRRQFNCAAEAFEKAVKLEPSSARLAYLLGSSLYSSGDLKGALDPLQESVRLDSRVLQPHLALGAAFDRLHEITAAEIEWRAALAIDPKSTVARTALSKDLLAQKDYGAEVALLRGPVDSKQSTLTLSEDLTLDLALAYGQLGMLQDANSLLRAAFHAHPASLPLAKALAATLVMQARKEEAAGVLEAAMKHHPADLGVKLLYLRILVMQDESEKAQQLGRQLLKAAPRNWEVLYLNGILERRAGDYTAARDNLEKAVALNPDHYESRRNLGSVLVQLKEARGAREQLEKAIALGSHDPEVRFELAGVLRTLGEDREADNQLKLYQQEAQAKSDLTQAAAKSAFADQKLASGDVSQAVDLYREALAGAPQEATLAYKLAMALDKAGDLKSERAALEQAIQIDPGMAEAQNQLGYLASRAGETASAEEHFRLAVQLSPGYAKAWVNLAATLYLESKLPEAKQAVERALQVEPGNQKAQELNRELAQTPR